MRGSIDEDAILQTTRMIAALAQTMKLDRHNLVNVSNRRSNELSEKYRELYERSKELVDEAAVVIRRASKTAKDQLR